MLTVGQLLRCQNPIRLPNVSEPEPDVAIVRQRKDSYLDGHPEPAGILLLVEVVDCRWRLTAM
ncbi:MAG: hypothetical protein AAF685_17445 [Cyanobacteria bacterium P01_C01_bin.89]